MLDFNPLWPNFYTSSPLPHQILLESEDSFEGLGVTADVGEIEGLDLLVDGVDELHEVIYFALRDVEGKFLELAFIGFDELEGAARDDVGTACATIGLWGSAKFAGVLDEHLIEHELAAVLPGLDLLFGVFGLPAHEGAAGLPVGDGDLAPLEAHVVYLPG